MGTDRQTNVGPTALPGTGPPGTTASFSSPVPSHSPLQVTPMKRRCPLLACAALWLLAPATAAAQTLPVKTVEFQSDAVGRKMKYNIVLPAKYENSTERYPVLYLLHGLTSNYTAWARM